MRGVNPYGVAYPVVVPRPRLFRLFTELCLTIHGVGEPAPGLRVDRGLKNEKALQRGHKQMRKIRYLVLYL
jgi:hypothetical protein